MTLLPDWKRVLRRAWSIRLVLISGALSISDVLLSLWLQVRPSLWLAVASGLISIAAIVARLVPQRELHEEPK
jgi:uncharacterized membrane protein YbhN (UPF0104 family)